MNKCVKCGMFVFEWMIGCAVDYGVGSGGFSMNVKVVLVVNF